MIGMMRASRPSCVCEAVVHVLLNVIDDALFKIGCVFAEQTHARRNLFHDCVVSGSDATCEIL